MPPGVNHTFRNRISVRRGSRRALWKRAGLIVGIIAYFGYNYLVSRVDSVVRKLEARTMEFLDLLNEPA